jgi:formylglycine-generating enzyme required for sulfatase activity
MFRIKSILPTLAAVFACSASAQNVGTSFCSPTNNSTGASALLVGTAGSGVGSNLHLGVTQGVPNEIGYFLAGNEATAGVMISNGVLCLVGTGSAALYRYNVAGGDSSSVGLFDANGVLQNLVGTSTTGLGFDVPGTIPSGVPITIMSGDTWHFQLWHRDTPAGGGTSNFSNGLSVTFPVVTGLTLISGMVPIPAGTFDMGSDAAGGSPYFGDSQSQPVHSVTISQDFWMGEHEVTQAEFLALMGVNSSQFQGPNRPVDHVGWSGANDYCAALTVQERALGNIPANLQYRLPTEAEWEYACRAGSTTEYNVGQVLQCSDAQIGWNYHLGAACPSGARHTDVASYAANAFGLYDMHGNVPEWCLSRFYQYSAGPETDPYNSDPGLGGPILRGGSAHLNSSKSRSGDRSLGNGDFGGNGQFDGFRVVLGSVLVDEPLQIAGMVLIPAGTFDMGSDAASGAPYFNNSDAQPVHNVTISQAFWMGEHEVTQAEYSALMGSNPSEFSGVNLPVETVTWNDAVAYCTALTAQEMALGNVPAGMEYRLPTEAEWEYACRAGTTTEFNFGADLFCADARISFSEHSNSSCGVSSTVDVGSHAANAFGLYDMHGNVYEWCLDTFASYGSGAVADPFVTGGSQRVIRGGAWLFSSYLTRSGARNRLSPPASNEDIGFRVVLGKVIDPFFAPVSGMVLIPAGTFDMGSNVAAGAPYLNVADAQPVHNVTISQDFWMGEHEVTQAEYSAITGVAPSSFSGDNLPVETVSWQDAVAYCTALTAQEIALGNVPAGMEYRLPTEAEWEYACRAGTTTEFNVGADLFCADARFAFSYHSNSSCGVSSTIAVGSYAPNAFGLYDMHGNVWEWCLDYYASYDAAAVTDPFVTGGLTRVVRGGSWDGPSSPCRSAFRNSSSSGFSGSSVGFRVVLAKVLDPFAAPVPSMVLIPAGTFDMGSDAASTAPYYNGGSQQPVHNVTISEAFWMGETEVTQAEYQALMGTNPSLFIGVNLPVDTVSWHDARAYCAALTAQEQAAGNVPAGQEYRLPTEAEWEYACRAGTTSEFNVGPDLYCANAQFAFSEHSNSSCTVAGPVAVGSYPANGFGLFDMHGNVMEWCLDSYVSYSAGAVTDPFMTGIGPYRSIRGGSWSNSSPGCRSAVRGGASPGLLINSLGFRVVLARVLVP